jgi:Ferritin-like domain
MTERQLFGGAPVIEFNNEQHRRNFLKSAAIVGVGATLVAGGGAVGRFAQAQSGSDIDILNYALTLEYLEATFYKKGVAGGSLSGRELALVTPIRDHEVAHVAALTATVKKLGGKPVAMPKFKFPAGTFTNRNKFLTTASTFEELGVTAYHGQVTKIKSTEILAAAAAIAGTESRHAAILADLTGGDPFPAPIEAKKSMSQVLAAAKPFIA